MEPRDLPQYRTVLRAATERLRTCLSDAPAGSGETPYLDAVVLLAHAAALTKEQLFASFEDQVPDTVLQTFHGLLESRCDGLPVSYIRGTKEFYGREFLVGPGVLVPRPDTETLVESALGVIDEFAGRPPHVHDCCTGSGCVALTLACERDCRVTAADVCEDALDYARRNAAALNQSRVEFWCGDLLLPLSEWLAGNEESKPMIITANPPYVADNEVEDLRRRGWPEPAVALMGGPDGLDCVRRLSRDAPACLADGGSLLVEIGADQGQAAASLFESAGFAEVSLVQDLAGKDRVCRGRWYRQ